MTVYAITDTKKGRTGIAPTYLQTTLGLWRLTHGWGAFQLSRTQTNSYRANSYLSRAVRIELFTARVLYRVLDGYRK